MGNLLLKYLNDRLSENHFEKQPKKLVSNPVITISREAGCNGVKLANLLAESLNKRNPPVKWKVISKEVFFESAKMLNMNPEEIKKTLNQKEKFVLDGIIKAFNEKRFKSEQTIAKTTREVIQHFALDGYCIIVGRAGNVIAKDIQTALHVRLIAPLEYRIKTIMENDHLTREKAIEFIRNTDEERIAFREAIFGDKIKEDLFDLFLNRASFSNEAMVEMIEFGAKIKGIFNQ